LNICKRKVYRRILGPVYGNEKENWRIFAIVKTRIITERERERERE
jgi:hypothetical protein